MSSRVWCVVMVSALALMLQWHEAFSSYAGSASAIIDPSKVKQVSWKPRSVSTFCTTHVCIRNSISYLAIDDDDDDFDAFGAELSFTRVFWRNWNAITWFPSPNRSSRDPRWPIICPARASWAKSERAPACSFPRTRLVPPSLHLLPFIIEFLCASGRSDINLIST